MDGECVKLRQECWVFHRDNKQTSRLLLCLQEIDTINLTGHLVLETLAILIIRILTVVWIRQKGAGVSEPSRALG